jgi:gliding motility-associated protein GldE
MVLLLFSALISGSEVAFFSLTSSDYEEIELENTPVSQRILELRESPQYLLATILIANNFINIAIVLLSELLLSELFPSELFVSWAAGIQKILAFTRSWSELEMANVFGFLVTVIGVTFLLVLFGEVAPKIYARYNRMKLARIMSGPLYRMYQVFTPLSSLLVKGTEFLENSLKTRSDDAAAASREEIDEAIDLTVSNDEANEHSLQDVDILKRIVKFSNVTVRQIMKARVDVTSVDRIITYQELLEVVRQSGYSRIPVYEEDFDNVVGILYAKDLLGHLHEEGSFNWNSLVRTEVYFIPESKKISDLLREFQQEKMHMAIVIDEFGGTEGLVTLEDIMEEVIGDIHDEFDDAQEIIYEKVDDNNFIFDGKTLLNDVYRITGLDNDTFDAVKGESESFAGLILEMLGTFPVGDQEIEYPPYRFKVVSLGSRRIEEILITLPTEEDRK